MLVVLQLRLLQSGPAGSMRDGDHAALPLAEALVIVSSCMRSITAMAGSTAFEL
jgi:hypothetical protein